MSLLVREVRRKKGRQSQPKVMIVGIPIAYTADGLGAFHHGAGSNRLSSIASSTVAVMTAMSAIMSIIV